MTRRGRCDTRVYCVLREQYALHKYNRYYTHFIFTEIYLRTDEKRENRPPDNNIEYNVAKFRRWPAVDARDKIIHFYSIGHLQLVS